MSQAAKMQEFERLHGEGVCRYHAKGSDVLIVWFGGIDEPFFSRGLAEKSPFDSLYVKDSGFDWYMFGLHGTMLDRDDFAGLLARLHTRYKYLVFCGQSSGGYAALYYGLRAEAQLCIVFSPQTRNFFTGQNVMVPHVKLENIAALYAGAEKHPHVVINVARSESDHSDEFEWHDHRQIDRLKTLDRVTTIIHPYDNHAVSVILRNEGVLYKHIISTIRTYCDLFTIEDDWNET